MRSSNLLSLQHPIEGLQGQHEESWVVVVLHPVLRWFVACPSVGLQPPQR